MGDFMQLLCSIVDRKPFIGRNEYKSNTQYPNFVSFDLSYKLLQYEIDYTNDNDCMSWLNNHFNLS